MVSRLTYLSKGAACRLDGEGSDDLMPSCVSHKCISHGGPSLVEVNSSVILNERGTSHTLSYLLHIFSPFIKVPHEHATLDSFGVQVSTESV